MRKSLKTQITKFVGAPQFWPVELHIGATDQLIVTDRINRNNSQPMDMSSYIYSKLGPQCLIIQPNLRLF